MPAFPSTPLLTSSQSPAGFPCWATFLSKLDFGIQFCQAPNGHLESSTPCFRKQGSMLLGVLFRKYSLQCAYLLPAPHPRATTAVCSRFLKPDCSTAFIFLVWDITYESSAALLFSPEVLHLTASFSNNTNSFYAGSLVIHPVPKGQIKQFLSACLSDMKQLWRVWWVTKHPYAVRVRSCTYLKLFLGISASASPNVCFKTDIFHKTTPTAVTEPCEQLR